eukprot:1220618-Pyramimonas_sp.AAC.1
MSRRAFWRLFGAALRLLWSSPAKRGQMAMVPARGYSRSASLAALLPSDPPLYRLSFRISEIRRH